MNTYNAAESCAFSKANEPWGHLGNMAGKYPITISENIIAPSVENLYQSMRFTDYPNIQQEIMEQKSGFGAKMVSKKYRKNFTRSDFDNIKIDIMLWCLQLKASQHPNYRNLLLQTNDKFIVEISNNDQFWGAKPNHDNSIYTGHNVLGQLHMHLRDIIKSSPDNQLHNITTPNIHNFTLLNHNIS